MRKRGLRVRGRELLVALVRAGESRTGFTMFGHLSFIWGWGCGAPNVAWEHWTCWNVRGE